MRCLAFNSCEQAWTYNLPDTTQEAAERATAAEAAARDAGAAIARLEAHVADLESRKRAPLYQKRQEEELAAAVARAAEAEERAAAAEARAKDAKVRGGLRARNLGLRVTDQGPSSGAGARQGCQVAWRLATACYALCNTWIILGRLPCTWLPLASSTNRHKLLSMSNIVICFIISVVLWRTQAPCALQPDSNPQPCMATRRRARWRRSRPQMRWRSCSARSAARQMRRRLRRPSGSLLRRARLARRSRPRQALAEPATTSLCKDVESDPPCALVFCHILLLAVEVNMYKTCHCWHSWSASPARPCFRRHWC